MSVTVTGTATELDPDALTVPGTEQLPCGIDPEQESVTGPVNPPRKVAVTVGLAVPPGATETDCVDGDKLKSWPVPVSTSVSVVAPAVTENVVVRVPVSPDAGFSVAVNVQDEFAGMPALGEQGVVPPGWIVKSLVSVELVVNANVVLLAFVIVIVVGALVVPAS